MKMIEKSIGKEVIIRSDRAGVFFGTLIEKEGTEGFSNRIYGFSKPNRMKKYFNRGICYDKNIQKAT